MVSQRDTASRFSEFLDSLTIEDLRAELAATRQQMARLETQEQLLTTAIQWKEAGDSTPPSKRATKMQAPGPDVGDRRPTSLREAILWVLAEAGHPLRPVEIFDALATRGWAPTGNNARNQVSARLSKMAASDQVIRRGGLYRPPPGD